MIARTLRRMQLACTLAVAAAAGSAVAQDVEVERPSWSDNPHMHMVAVEALVVEIDEEYTRDLGLQYGFNPRTTENGEIILDDSSVLDGGNVTLGRPLNPVRVPVLIKGLEGETGISFDESSIPGLGVNLAGMNVSGQVVATRLRALLDQGQAVIRTRPSPSRSTTPASYSAPSRSCRISIASTTAAWRSRRRTSAS